jgi:hypothetical protein
MLSQILVALSVYTLAFSAIKILLVYLVDNSLSANRLREFRKKQLTSESSQTEAYLPFVFHKSPGFWGNKE